MPAINALLLGSVLYRSRLVPRVIPVLGLIGAPLLICTVIATLFGGFKLGSPELAALPVAAWELSLGVWLVVKGFRPSPITADMTAASTPLAYQRRRRLTVAQRGRALHGARPLHLRAGGPAGAGDQPRRLIELASRAGWRMLR